MSHSDRGVAPTIEIVGLPGSGKSTLGKLLAAELGVQYRVLVPSYDSGSPGMSRRAWRLRILRLVPVHPRIFLQGLGGWRRTRQRRLLTASFVAAFTASELQRVAGAVTDEGPRQSLAINLAVTRELDPAAEARAYSRLLPPANLTVWVECDPLVAQHRNGTRNEHDGYGRAGMMPVYLAHDRYSRAMEQLLSGEVVRVDSSATPPEELLTQVLEHAGEILGNFSGWRK